MQSAKDINRLSAAEMPRQNAQTVDNSLGGTEGTDGRDHQRFGLDQRPRREWMFEALGAERTCSVAFGVDGRDIRAEIQQQSHHTLVPAHTMLHPAAPCCAVLHHGSLCCTALHHCGATVRRPELLIDTARSLHGRERRRSRWRQCFAFRANAIAAAVSALAAVNGIEYTILSRESRRAQWERTNWQTEG